MKWLIIILILAIILIAGCTQTVECKIGEECNQNVSESCEKGYIFSEKDCKCVLDTFGCKGLDKETCEENPNCYSFNRSGSCSCPLCEIQLSHQCLPK